MYRYIDYLPGYLQEIRELRSIGEAADPLAEEAYSCIRRQYRNQLIEDADERTVSRWESILQLPYVDEYGLTARKQRILLRWQGRLPITVKKLREILEGITNTDCRVVVDGPHYAMGIEIYEHDFSRIPLRLISSEVYRLKPANLTMNIAIIAQSEAAAGLWAAAAPSVTRHYELTPRLPARSPDAKLRMCAGAGLYSSKTYEIEVEHNG